MSWHNQYIQIQFAERGRDRTEGVDCWGLTRLIYNDQLGVELPSLLHYTDTDDKTALTRGINEHQAMKGWIEVPIGQEKEFDVVLFKIQGFPMHVGIVVRPGFMVHCQRGINTTFEQYNDRRWVNRLEGFYRYAEGSDCSITVQSES